MKKTIAILLLLSMLLGALVSCQNEQPQTQGTKESETHENVNRAKKKDRIQCGKMEPFKYYASH